MKKEKKEIEVRVERVAVPSPYYFMVFAGDIIVYKAMGRKEAMAAAMAVVSQCEAEGYDVAFFGPKRYSNLYGIMKT